MKISELWRLKPFFNPKVQHDVKKRLDDLEMLDEYFRAAALKKIRKMAKKMNKLETMEDIDEPDLNLTDEYDEWEDDSDQEDEYIDAPIKPDLLLYIPMLEKSQRRTAKSVKQLFAAIVLGIISIVCALLEPSCITKPNAFGYFVIVSPIISGASGLASFIMLSLSYYYFLFDFQENINRVIDLYVEYYLEMAEYRL